MSSRFTVCPAKFVSTPPLNQTFIETLNQTLNQTFIETLNQTLNQTFIETLNQTFIETLNQTFIETLNQTRSKHHQTIKTLQQVF